MTNEEYLEIVKDIPKINPFSVTMNEANDSIKIHEGEFILKEESNEIIIFGNISFEWFPNSRVCFSGKPIKANKG